MPETFSKALQDVAAGFVELQKRRHDADYDPTAQFSRRTAESYILMAEDSIEKFRASAVSDRRAFVVWLLFPNRR